VRHEDQPLVAAAGGQRRAEVDGAGQEGVEVAVQYGGDGAGEA